MAENVTMKGKPFHLKGRLIQEGEKAPDCELTDNQMNPVRLSTFKGKSLLLLSVPSLDTSVCSKETHHFSKEIEKLGNWLNLVCVSMDLPFAQSRWCGAMGVKNITTLSDFKNREFGEKYGLLIPDLGLLARAVLLITPNMVIQHFYLVKEISEEPDYPTILYHLGLMSARTGIA